MDKYFLYAVEKVLEHEGGYVNDPLDPGGETNFGISKKSHPDLDIANITREEAVWIYFEDWWRRYGYWQIDDLAIAEKVFDLAVNMGPNKAHTLLQIVLNYLGAQVCIDGIIGPQTLDAVNHHKAPGHVLDRLKLEAVKFYLSLGNNRYEKGWIKRAVS